MKKKVLKFGGTSVGSIDRILHAAKIIKKESDSGNKIIAVVSAMVQLVEMIIEKFSPALYSSLGIFLPLIAVNCAILGGALFMQERQYSTIIEATSFALGSGVGWYLAIVAIAAIREKIRYSNVPAPLRGLGITYIITGLMGIAFMCFMGIKI